MSSEGPLAGLCVVEFGSYIAGPFAGQMLADLGADVIKVEPLSGDPWRHQGAFAPGESRVFLPLNRGVRSVCLDLKQPAAQQALSAIVRSADAVVSNNRPDTAEKLGIDYETLSEINDQLIYVEITAYGPRGPRAAMPGFDLIMQGFSGAIASEGKITGGHPDPVWSSSYIDFSTAYAAAGAVMAGVISRLRTGKGQKVTTSLYGNALAMQCMRLVRIEGMPSPPQVWFESELPAMQARGASYSEIQESYQQVVRSLDYRCYYRAYRTMDGGLALGTLAFHARKRLLEYLGLSDPRVDDPAYDHSTPEARQLSARLVEQFEQIFQTRTTDDWFRELRSRDIPCEPVRFIEEIPDDEQALVNDFVIELEHSGGFTYRSSGPVTQFSGGMPEQRPSPALGQHTREVLSQIGFDQTGIDALINSGAAGDAPARS